MTKKPVKVYLDEKDIAVLKKKAGRKGLSRYIRELIFIGLNKQQTVKASQISFTEEFVDKLAEALASRLNLTFNGQVQVGLTKQKIERKLKKDEVKRLLLEELKQVLARRREKK